MDSNEKNKTRRLKIRFFLANGLWIIGLSIGLILQRKAYQDAPLMLMVLTPVVPICAILYILYIIELLKKIKCLDKKDKIMFVLCLLIIVPSILVFGEIIVLGFVHSLLIIFARFL